MTTAAVVADYTIIIVSVTSVVLGLSFIQALRFFVASGRGKGALTCLSRRVAALPEAGAAAEEGGALQSRTAEPTARTGRGGRTVHPDSKHFWA